LTTSFPNNETYGLVSQFRRAAVSIAANISEGFVKKGKADKLRFYDIAQGSIQECKYYLILSKDLNYSNDENLIDMLDEVAKILQSYINSVNSKY
jgi:four helix bundle protein